MKKTIRMNESELHQLISESVKRVVNEGISTSSNRDIKFANQLNHVEYLYDRDAQSRNGAEYAYDGRKHENDLNDNDFAQIFEKAISLYEYMQYYTSHNQFGFASTAIYTAKSDLKHFLTTLRHAAKQLKQSRGMQPDTQYYNKHKPIEHDDSFDDFDYNEKQLKRAENGYPD